MKKRCMCFVSILLVFGMLCSMGMAAGAETAESGLPTLSAEDDAAFRQMIYETEGSGGTYLDPNGEIIDEKTLYHVACLAANDAGYLVAYSTPGSTIWGGPQGYWEICLGDYYLRMTRGVNLVFYIREDRQDLAPSENTIAWRLKSLSNAYQLGLLTDDMLEGLLELYEANIENFTEETQIRRLSALTLGDLNLDDNLTITDVVQLRQAILKIVPGVLDCYLGDLNADDSISVTDVVLLRKAILETPAEVS